MLQQYFQLRQHKQMTRKLQCYLVGHSDKRICGEKESLRHFFNLSSVVNSLLHKRCSNLLSGETACVYLYYVVKHFLPALMINNATPITSKIKKKLLQIYIFLLACHSKHVCFYAIFTFF